MTHFSFPNYSFSLQKCFYFLRYKDISCWPLRKLLHRPKNVLASSCCFMFCGLWTAYSLCDCDLWFRFAIVRVIDISRYSVSILTNCFPKHQSTITRISTMSSQLISEVPWANPHTMSTKIPQILEPDNQTGKFCSKPTVFV